MAVVGAGLGEDPEGLDLLIRDLDRETLQHAVRELVQMAVESLVSKAEQQGLTRGDVTDLWQACILDCELG